MGQDEIEDVLIAAIENGEILTVIYLGGSKPGSARQIQPRSIDGNKIRAIDIASGRNKQFLINKIEIANDDDLQAEYTPDIYHRKATTQELISYHVTETEKLGWVARYTNTSISLYQRFKNGNLRKTPSVKIYYDELVTEYIIDLDGELIEVTHPAVRPWHTASRTFKNPNKAFERFWSDAVKNAPKS